MGGYVALYMAKHYPERVGKIITVATKLDWNLPTAEKEVRMLNPEKILEKIPKFAVVLEKRHSPQDWKEVLSRTQEMMLAMGADPPLKDDNFRAINQRVLMCVGDGDTMVSQEETKRVAALIPNSALKILELTPHPIEQMNVELLVKTAENFFNS
jgi:pimeloyl-ACP methyl ester carboxylesterase